MKKILIVCSSRGAVNYHRMIIPHARLSQLHDVKIEHTVDDRAWVNMNPTELHAIVFTRMVALDGIEFKNQNVTLEALVKIFKNYGVKFILDIDDWWVLDKHHILYEQYGDWYGKQTERSIRLMDLVITTNKRLLKKIRAVNKKVVIIPNCVNRNEPQWKSKALPKKFKVGYLGGQTHKEDVDTMLTDFSKFDAVAFDPMYKQNGFKIQEPKDEYSYANLYNDLTVSLAPILHTPFNSCKSNLKIIEAATKGRLIMCTNENPYKGFENVVYVNSGESWESKLNELKETPLKDLKKQAKLLQEEVMESYNLDKWTGERFRIYKNL